MKPIPRVVTPIVCAGCDETEKLEWLQIINGKWYCYKCANEIRALKQGADHD